MYEFDAQRARPAVRREQQATVRRRLVVGAADDPAERAADTVAEHVLAEMTRPAMATVATSRIQRRDAGGDAEAAPHDVTGPASTTPASRIRPMSHGVDAGHTIRRAFRQTTVTKPAGASLHKSDRKSKKAAARGAAKVRSGGVFGTGLKIKVPNGAVLEVDDHVQSTDQLYVLARYNGVTGYIAKANVTAAPLGPNGTPSTATVPTTAPVTAQPDQGSESSSEPETLDDVLTGAANLRAGLDAALDAFPGVRIDSLAPFIEAAPQTERDAVWHDAALMAKAKRVLTLDDYLALLPALRVFTPPTGGTFPGAQPGYVGHTSAAEVDRLIGQHLGKYVAAAKSVGRKAEGEISVVDEDDWKLAFERQWPGVDPTMANAFVDVDQPKRHIWLHKDRGDPGTAIHEGMHKYADDTIRNVQRSLYRAGMVAIGRLDEGLTEYFCRLVTRQIGITRQSYPAELAFASKLVRHVGEGVAASAYFDGQFDRFIDTYLATTHRTRAHWDLLSRVFEGDEDDLRAMALLKSGAEA